MLKKYFRIVLWKIFKFEKWHISLLEQRQYAQDVIDFANKQDLKNTVEIGTGLGDIIRNIHSEKKLCLDIDSKVLNANRFLSFFHNKSCKHIHFEEFDIHKNELKGKYDFIIMVNWIHNIESELLQKTFSKFINQNIASNGYLVFDVLENKSYKYNHSVDSLLSEINNIDILVADKQYEYNRKLIYVKKIK